MCVCEVSSCVLNHFSCVRLSSIPWTVAHLAPLSIGFSRQEYWSGLPSPPPRDLPNPGIEPRSPALQVDSLPSEPPGKPKNIGVSSLSLLQGICPTQKSNQSVLHCRQILYQLSYLGGSNIFLREETSPFNPAVCSQQIQSDNPVIKICSLPLFKLW